MAAEQASFDDKYPETRLAEKDLERVLGMGWFRPRRTGIKLEEAVSPVQVLPLAAHIYDQTGGMQPVFGRTRNSFDAVAHRILDHCTVIAPEAIPELQKSIGEWYDNRPVISTGCEM